MERSILVIDDEADMLNLLKRTLSKDLEAKVATAASGEAALALLEEERFDLILSDIRMPGMDGLSLLSHVKEVNPEQTVLMMTAHGDVDTVVEAMKQGAYDFITKPFDLDALVMRLEKAFERTTLLRENLRLQRQCRSGNIFEEMVGKSVAMQRVFETINMVAGTDVTVLITGESGTGKNMVAKAIHAMGNRSCGPFVAVNCPTVPENILESELFGYKKGAFTHATGNRTGLFQEAHRGTIFLDEIGEVSPSIQTKLLRVLQEKKIKPLGDTAEKDVDVRIIASTNQDLPELIRTGAFREDFYYRLNILPIHMPPLRERRKDIPLISGHLVKKHCGRLEKEPKTISPELMDHLMEGGWEGNIRELENILIRGIIYSVSNIIEARDAGFTREIGPRKSTPARSLSGLDYKAAKEEVLMEFNHTYIGERLAISSGNVTKAARECGLERQALQQVMKRYAINATAYRKKGNT